MLMNLERARKTNKQTRKESNLLEKNIKVSIY